MFRESAAYDVLVLGGGNAALCAAIEARSLGASVLILEAAPEALRGGNSRHTRNVRYMHVAADRFLTGAYAEDEFFVDLLEVTGGDTDERLARLTIRASADIGGWMAGNGVRWQPPLRGTLQLSRTNAFFLGGGKALLNTHYAAAQGRGVTVWYDSEVTDLSTDADGLQTASVLRAGRPERIRSKAAVVATGGFEANIEWLSERWGGAVENFAIRGTPFNKGRLLKALLDRDAQPAGNAGEYHAVAVDARGPRFDGGIATRLDCIPFGIVVNKHAQRFADEGSDFWPKRYAVWGGLIARQPDQIAYSILDSKMMSSFMPSLYPPIRADSVRELAAVLGLDAETLDATVVRFNAAVSPGTFDGGALDDCRTRGLEVAKSHWARPLDTPPYFAYPLRPGITFTYYGLKVNESAQVILRTGKPMAGVFAAGEVMAGNILGRGYLAGLGMTIDTVFGRIAGREAAKYALA